MAPRSFAWEPDERRAPTRDPRAEPIPSPRPKPRTHRDLDEARRCRRRTVPGGPPPRLGPPLAQTEAPGSPGTLQTGTGPPLAPPPGGTQGRPASAQAPARDPAARASPIRRRPRGARGGGGRRGPRAVGRRGRDLKPPLTASRSSLTLFTAEPPAAPSGARGQGRAERGGRRRACARLGGGRRRRRTRALVLKTEVRPKGGPVLPAPGGRARTVLHSPRRRAPARSPAGGGSQPPRFPCPQRASRARAEPAKPRQRREPEASGRALRPPPSPTPARRGRHVPRPEGPPCSPRAAGPLARPRRSGPLLVARLAPQGPGAPHSPPARPRWLAALLGARPTRPAPQGPRPAPGTQVHPGRSARASGPQATPPAPGPPQTPRPTPDSPRAALPLARPWPLARAPGPPHARTLTRANTVNFTPRLPRDHRPPFLEKNGLMGE